MIIKRLLHWTPIIICVFNICNLQGQIPLAPVNVQSPNAASLGQFGKIPVSYYTGLPNIQVPLYTLHQKETSIPITLSYHASGVRPDMHPGWVGMGFALSSGGVVSRVVKDSRDDYSNYFLGANRGFYYNRNILNTTSWNQTSYIQGVARGNEMLKDTEPDEFSFNAGGISGNFYLHANGTWKVKSDRPIRVSLIPGSPFLSIPFAAPLGTSMFDFGMSQSFAGFIVTTDDGTKYQFGGSTDAIEYSIGFFSQRTDEWCASSWFLTKITATNGEVIDFSYERDDFINQMYIGIVNDLGTKTKNSGGIFNPQPACSSTSYSQVYDNYNGKLVAPVYLKQIDGIHTVIKFNRSTSTELRYDLVVYEYKYDQWSSYGGGSDGIDFLPILSPNGTEYYLNTLNKLQWKKLDQIRVETKDGSLVKAFNFTYNNSLSERLMLQSVQEVDKNLAALPPYSFEYISSYPLPGYLSNKVDHWGFHNGTYADMSNQNTYYTTYYNYRNPVELYLFTGTLKKITFPTGGVTEFTYEPHYYSRRLQEVRANGIDNSFNANTLAGGLRIKKIVSYDPLSPLQKQEKKYFYVNGYTKGADINSLMSSGVLGGQTKYYFSDYSRRAFNDNDVTYSKSLFSSQSVLPGSDNAQGSHVGYTNVVELLSDGSYTVYNFSNFDNGRNDESGDNILQLTRTSYEPCSSTEQERGNLLKESNYNADGIKLKERHISYISLNKNNEFVPSLKANRSNVCPNTAVSVEEGTAYRLYTYSYLPSSESVYEFDNLGNVFSQIHKSYNYNTTYRLLTEQTTFNSKGQEVKNTYTYPFDNPSLTTQSVMISENILNPVIEERKYVDNVQTSATFTNYAVVAAPSTILPVAVTTQTTAVSTNSQKALAQYDDKGNMVRFRKNFDDVGMCYLWSYGGQLPIAKIENAEYTNIVTLLGGATAITNFRDILNPTPTQITNFLAPLYSLDQALVTTYAHEPLKGITSSTDARGKTTYFDYDLKLRLMGIKDFNGDIIRSLDYNYRQP